MNDKNGKKIAVEFRFQVFYKIDLVYIGECIENRLYVLNSQTMAAAAATVLGYRGYVDPMESASEGWDRSNVGSDREDLEFCHSIDWVSTSIPKGQNKIILTYL